MSGGYPAQKFQEKAHPLDLCFTCWMYDTTRRLEHLIALCEIRRASGKSEAREISPPTRVN